VDGGEASVGSSVAGRWGRRSGETGKGDAGYVCVWVLPRKRKESEK